MKHFCLNRGSLIFLILITAFVSVSAQESDKRDFLKAFQNADTYFYYDQNYFKAANLYEPLVASHPDNYNLAAKLGICYLNLDGKNAEALKLLKSASRGVVSTEKEYKQTGEKAPLDTYLYLAIAFHRNDSLEQALTFFNDAKRNLANTEPYQEDFIDLQIRNCRYAMEMKKRPLRIISEYFTPWLLEVYEKFPIIPVVLGVLGIVVLFGLKYRRKMKGKHRFIVRTRKTRYGSDLRILQISLAGLTGFIPIRLPVTEAP